MIQLSRSSAPADQPAAVLTLQTAPRPDPANRMATILLASSQAMFALLIALPYLTMPIPKLLNWVADDAFYYLQIARHIARSGVSTFDGITRTNGYHPLWMLCCTLLASVIHDRAALLRAALCLAFACHAATGLLLARLLKPYTGEFWAKIGGAAWLFNPLALHMCLCLTEAPLYILCLTAALITLQNACDAAALPADDSNNAKPRRRALIRLGIACGAALLARTDAACLIAPALLCVAAAHFRHAPQGSRARCAAKALALPAAICAAAFAPWLAYSWANVHTFAQDSGVMKALWQSEWGNAIHLPLSARIATAARFTLGDWLQRTIEVTFQLPNIAADTLAGAATALACLSAYLLRGRAGHSRMLAATALLAGVTISMGMAYGYGVSDHQVWHLAEPALAVWLILFAWTGALASKEITQRHKIAAGIALLGGAALLGVTGAREFAPHYPWQVDVYNSQPILERLVPQGERIGCFNAGIPAYFSDRTIINLDGLVNHDAVPYWKAHRFGDYLAAAHIHYIIDESDAVNRAQAFSSNPIPLDVIASGPLNHWNPPVRYLLRVNFRTKN